MTEPLNDKGEPIDEAVYRQFARAYPHECYASDPERFWVYYHSQYPDISREEMELILEETSK